MAQNPKQWYHETLGQKAVEALRRNNFGAEYAADRAEACRQVLAMIPEGASIAFGGSMTVAEIGLLDQLKSGPYKLINPPWAEEGLSRKDRNELRRSGVLADVFLASTNSVTLDGKMVNVDGTANRVAGMLFGPKKTILVAGVNKIVRNLDEAMERTQQVASPMNCKRLNTETPCTKTGVCSDCTAPGRICNATVILHRKTGGTDLTVVVVGEDLGY